MLGHKQFFDDLLSSRNGLDVHSVHFVRSSVLEKTPKEQLESVGVEEFEPIFFGVDGDSYCKNGELNPSNSDYTDLGGGTINIDKGEGPEQVILVQSDFPVQFKDDPESQDDYESMLKLIALSHELGHVQDMQLESCSNFSYGDKPKVDLVEAEAYAHAYCPNYLHSVGAYTARTCLTDSLYRLHIAKSRFEKQLYTAIGKRVGKGRMKKWRSK